MQLTLWDIPKC